MFFDRVAVQEGNTNEALKAENILIAEVTSFPDTD
jgi:hypothetical protein